MRTTYAGIDVLIDGNSIGRIQSWTPSTPRVGRVYEIREISSHDLLPGRSGYVNPNLSAFLSLDVKGTADQWW